MSNNLQKLSKLPVLMFCASYGTIGVTGILRPIYVIPLSVLFLISGFIFAIPFLSKCRFSKQNLMISLSIFCLILQVSVVYFLNIENGLIKHFLAIVFLFIVWVQCSEVLINALGAVPQILLTNVGAIYISCFLALIGYFVYLGAGYDIFEIFGRLKEPSAMIARGVPRVYGLSSQPSQFAFYLLAFAPLAFATHYAYIQDQKWRKTTIIFPLIFVPLAFALTFSVGAFCAVSVSVFLTLIIKGKTTELLLSTLFFMIILTFFFLIQPEIIENLFGKLTLTGPFKSVEQRVAAATFALHTIFQNPFGAGIGFLTKTTGSTAINWYLTFWAECGIIGVIIFCCFSALVFRAINRTPENLRFALRFGFICTLISLNFHSTIGTSPLWPLSALIMVMARPRLRGTGDPLNG